MEFSFKQSESGITAELTVISGSATIVEDVAVSVSNGKWGIDTEIQYNLIDTLMQMNRAEGKSEIDFINYLYENWLSKPEQQEFIAKITGNE